MKRRRKTRGGEKWYEITSMGQHTERVKAILRREGFNVFRKGGEKLEWQVKKKRLGRRSEKNDKNEEGMVYQIKCEDCEKVYIGKTKFKMEKKSRSTQKKTYSLERYIVQWLNMYWS